MYRYLLLTILLFPGCRNSEETERNKMLLGSDYSTAYNHLSSFSDKPEQLLNSTCYEYHRLTFEVKDTASFLNSYDSSEVENIIKSHFPDFHRDRHLQDEYLAKILFDMNHFNFKEDLKLFPDFFQRDDLFSFRLGYKNLTYPISFIAEKQNQDGSWGDKNKLITTSLIVYGLLCSGETHLSRYIGSTVKKAFKFLMSTEPSTQHQLAFQTLAYTRCIL